MLELILLVYAGIAWLIFKKFKLLPWNITSQVVTFLIPIVGILVLIMFMNVYTPITDDVRIINKVVRINPLVRGRVTKIHIDPNTMIEKGDTLFTIESDTYELAVEQLKLQIIKAEADLVATNYQYASAVNNTKSVKSKLDLAEKRRDQYEELVANEAATRFELEKIETEVYALRAQYKGAQAVQQKIFTDLSVEIDGVQISVAQLQNKLARAEYDLEQCTVYAPANGKVVNLQLREGSIVTPIPAGAVMSFIEEGNQDVLAFFTQNELHKVQPGNEVEITLMTQPGKVYKGEVESIIWATGEGQLTTSGGQLPNTAPRSMNGHPLPPSKYAVRLKMDDTFEMGSRGMGTIYASTAEPFYIIRKVMVRISAKVNYIIPKLH